MSETNKVLVFGATGSQGGSVIDHLINHYPLRAVVRDPTSEKSVALAKRGVELVKGDLTTSVPDAAYEGIHTVFLVTVIDIQKHENETTTAIPVVDAAKKAGVSQFIFSTLPNSSIESEGKVKVPHFDTKAAIEEYIRKQGFKYTAFPALAFYYQNFEAYFPPKPDENGNLVLSLPITASLIALDVSQAGLVVKGIIDDPEKWNGQFICVAGDKQSPQHYADLLGAKAGKKCILNSIPHDVFASFGFPMAEEIAVMFKFFHEYEFYGTRDWQQAKNSFPEIRSFKDFIGS